MKSARPPIAAPIRIGAEVEEYIDYCWVAGEGYDRWRIEGEQRLVDSFAQFGVPLEEDPHGICIPPPERVINALFRRSCRLGAGFDLLFERRPVAESVFTRENELRIGERDLLLVRQDRADACS